MKAAICLIVAAHVAVHCNVVSATPGANGPTDGEGAQEWTVPSQHTADFRELLDNAAARYPKLPQRRKLRSHVADVLAQFCKEKYPSSHSLVTAMLERHKGKEETLLAALRQKYKEGAQPSRPPETPATEPPGESGPAGKEAAQHGTSALVIGARGFLGRNTALELRKSKKYKHVFLLDNIHREMLVEPWQIAESVLLAVMPNAPLLDAKVTVVRCDRSLPCLTEVLASRHWDLVVDLSLGDVPRSDAMAPAVQAAATIGHYVLVTTAAVYGHCQPAGRAQALPEDESQQNCPDDPKATPWREAWQALEQPLWATNHALSFTV
eukprot:COSAG05_NODE_5304_length_1211_cov_1.042266_1_plen_322_part_01